MEPEDRASAGVIRLRRLKWNKKTEQQQGLLFLDKEAVKSSWNKKTEQQQG